MSLFLLDYFGSIIQIRTAAVPPPGVPRLTKKQRNLRMKKIALFICVAALAGCTKVPERLYNPVAVFKAEVKDGATYYTVYIKGIIINEHPETVLKNMRGTVTLRNGGRDVMALPFEVPQLLPLQKFTINTEKGGDDREMAPLFAMFQISPDQLVPGLEATYSDEKQVRNDSIKFEISSYETENIFDVIKGK